MGKATKPKEELLTVVASDRKKIYCTLGYPRGKPRGMVIFVHGLSSTELWPPMLLGSWYFRSKGYAYCRINLYNWAKDARTLMTSDLLQHSRDTESVVKHLRKRGHSKFFAIGHSFGGLTLLQTDSSLFQALSFWDISSFISYSPLKRIKRFNKTGIEYLPGGVELLMSKRYKRSIEKFPDELQLISKINVPCQICYAAGKGAMLIESSKRYYRHVKSKRELVAIPNATHSFTEEGVSKLLFRKTLQWFNRS